MKSEPVSLDIWVADALGLSQEHLFPSFQQVTGAAKTVIRPHLVGSANPQSSRLRLELNNSLILARSYLHFDQGHCW